MPQYKEHGGGLYGRKRRRKEIEPLLAESWEINQDATQYTFKFRGGVTFSDGTPWCGGGGRTVDEQDPIKTPLAVGSLGRADPDAIKSNFHPENRNRLLQLGGSSKAG
jgi:ABC-type transport system substrate-binding protein